MTSRTLLTIEEYHALPEKEGVKYELDEGELITVLASPSLFHNMIRDRLGSKLYVFVEEHKLGLVTWETDFCLSETTVRIPDISFEARLAYLYRPGGHIEVRDDTQSLDG
jgi:Uma2 family endonuclease